MKKTIIIAIKASHNKTASQLFLSSYDIQNVILCIMRNLPSSIKNKHIWEPLNEKWPRVKTEHFVLLNILFLLHLVCHIC